MFSLNFSHDGLGHLRLLWLGKVNATSVLGAAVIALAPRGARIVDLEKAGSILITELRAGNLGQITLETPEMVSQEQIDAKAEEGAKAKEKAEREAERKRKAQRKYR